MAKLTTYLSTFWQFLVRVNKGRAFCLLEKQLHFERVNNLHVQRLQREQIAALQAEIQRINDDRVLLCKGIIPPALRPPHKPPTQREFGPDGAIREAVEAKAKRKAEAEAWLAAHSNPTNSEKVN